MKAKLIPFANAPFPYFGDMPKDAGPFLNAHGPSGLLGHLSPRGGFYAANTTYADNRALVALPQGFELNKNAVILVYFHGNEVILERDVVHRQRLLDQLQRSDLNAALVAPQFAVNALDSSAGHFWEPDAFAHFMSEAARALADLSGTPEAAPLFAAMPIILVAFSGGYNPAAFVLTLGGAGRRIIGVVLLDALYGERDRFADWIRKSHRHAFFFSTYTESSETENVLLESELSDIGIRASKALPQRLVPGEVVICDTPGVDHSNYVTDAWVRDPITWLLDRVPDFPR